jgi:CheY-like chemotaxis protein
MLTRRQRGSELDAKSPLRGSVLPAILQKEVPIIAVTSYALAGDDAQALAAGCIAYVSKPFSPRPLLAKVREYLA